jgi:hypothetical protein
VSNDTVDVADVEEEKENPVAKDDDVSRLLVATATARRIHANYLLWGKGMTQG